MENFIFCAVSKAKSIEKNTLAEYDNIITQDIKIAEILNSFFLTVTKNTLKQETSKLYCEWKPKYQVFFSVSLANVNFLLRNAIKWSDTF